MESKDLIVFQNKKIRRVWHNNEWWFSVVDVIAALTDSDRARKYWSDLKIKLSEEGFELSEKIGQLKLQSTDGKYYLTDCANTKNMLRIIQSIPSPKAEPFKQWLAQVGYERIEEIQNPELAQQRMKELYRQKGYSDEWIEKRIRGIAVRQELTDEWKNRGVREKRDFAILTNEISNATFGKTVDEYKQHKSLRRNDNLRDHMNDLELIFTMLGEEVTTKIAQKENTHRLNECKTAAKKGGDVAGRARKDAEEQIGEPVVSEDNYLDTPEKIKRLTKKRKQDENLQITN